jgi:hypothetical protein
LIIIDLNLICPFPFLKLTNLGFSLSSPTLLSSGASILPFAISSLLSLFSCSSLSPVQSLPPSIRASFLCYLFRNIVLIVMYFDLTFFFFSFSFCHLPPSGPEVPDPGFAEDDSVEELPSLILEKNALEVFQFSSLFFLFIVLTCCYDSVEELQVFVKYMFLLLCNWKL